MTPSVSKGQPRQDGKGCSSRPAFLDNGPWIFGATSDLLVFGGSAAVALFIVGAFAFAGTLTDPVPDWLWIGCILLIDVAHVWSTLFRTLFDGAELRRRPWIYVATPLLAYTVGTSIYHALGARAFWHALAYLAVIHFVRQQAGWIALYRHRSHHRSRFDLHLDRVAIYSATMYPILHWHAVGPKSFSWLIDGDFLLFATHLRPFVVSLEPVYWSVLIAFILRQVTLLVHGRGFHHGKVLLVLTTWVCWWLGIIRLNSDIAFTVTNVLIHGVPYLLLTYRYGRHRARAPGTATLQRLLSFGFPAFLTVVFALAFIEEALWDRLVFPDRPWLFGQGFQIPGAALGFVVPLLALPQLTHYVWDGFIWRRGSYPVAPSAGT